MLQLINFLKLCYLIMLLKIISVDKSNLYIMCKVFVDLELTKFLLITIFVNQSINDVIKFLDIFSQFNQ